MEYEIIQNFTSQNRSGQPLNPIGCELHETDTLNATALNEIGYENNGYHGSNAHIFIDDISIRQCIPFNEIGWGAGTTANSKYIHVELCHFDDSERFQEVWKRAVWLFAKLEKEIIKVKAITNYNLPSHADTSMWWKETDHTDPIEYFAQHGKTVADFRKDVQTLMDGCTIIQTTTTTTVNNIKESIKMKYIVKGEISQRVKILQALLLAEGYSISVDGDFGQMTFNIVEQFQRDKQITIDGIVGEQTIGTMLDNAKNILEN